MRNIAVISDQFPHVPHGGKGEWGYIQELNHHAEIPEAKEDILDAGSAQEGQPISGFYARLMLIVLNAVVFLFVVKKLRQPGFKFGADSQERWLTTWN